MTDLQVYCGEKHIAVVLVYDKVLKIISTLSSKTIKITVNHSDEKFSEPKVPRIQVTMDTIVQHALIQAGIAPCSEV